MDNKNSYDEAEIEQLRQELRPMLAGSIRNILGNFWRKIEAALKKIGSEPRLRLIKGGRAETQVVAERSVSVKKALRLLQ